MATASTRPITARASAPVERSPIMFRSSSGRFAIGGSPRGRFPITATPFSCNPNAQTMSADNPMTISGAGHERL